MAKIQLKKQELLKQIDLAPLSKELSEITGYFVDLNGWTKKDRSGEPYLAVNSNELKDKTGVMALVYDTVKIGHGVSDFVQDGSYMLSLHFNFEYKNGGSNGTKVLDAWYNFETKTWTIK